MAANTLSQLISSYLLFVTGELFAEYEGVNVGEKPVVVKHIS